jgi:hypothetical protein
MADRFWVTGGNGTWTSTTNWSATAGGASGATVPTAADSVFFDRTATYTVSIATGSVCLNITVSAGTVTFGGSATLTISGSMSLIAGTLWTNTQPLVFASTASGRTITTNGVSFPCNITFGGAGGVWTLGSALTTTGLITISNGAFNTSAAGNYALTCASIQATAATTASISLNASTVTLRGAGSTTNISGTGLTFNAGTSQLNIGSSSGYSLSTNNRTFYNVTFTATNSTQASYSIGGVNTFNNLTFTPQSNTAILSVRLSANQTINGTLSASGPAITSRIFIQSDTLGTARTLTLASPTTLTNCDFRDITSSRAITATAGGNCGGNTNITFPAAKTVYWNLTGSQTWTATGWATSSGGTPNAANFPLAQDTVVFDNAGAATTVDQQSPGYNIGTLNMSARTTAVALSFNAGTPNVYGSWILGTGVTFPVAGTLTFAGRGNTQDITSAGITFPFSLQLDNIGGTVRLTSALTLSSTQTVSHRYGTFDLQSYTLTTGRFVTNTSTRTLAFGTGNITLIGTVTVWSAATTSLTVTGSRTVNVVISTAGTVFLSPGSQTEANAVDFNISTGSYPLSIGSGSVFRTLNFTGFSGTVNNVTQTVYGNLNMGSTATFTAGANIWTFASKTAGRTITTNAKTVDFPIAFSGTGGSWILQDALTMGATRTASLTGGTLNLNNFTLTTGFFTSSGSTARTIAFGTGNITLIGAGGTLCNISSITNMTTTGTQIVNVSYAGAVATTITPGALPEADSISFNFTAGTYALTLNSGAYRNLNFTGYAGTVGNQAQTIYGNLTLAAAATYTAGTNTWTFASTSTGKTITTNAETMGFPLTFNGVGGSWILQDALTMGSTRTLTHTNGTLDLNGKTLTVGTSYTTATGTKNLTFNGGTLVCPTAATTAFNNVSPAGFTTTAGTGTGTISMTAATAKSFRGNGSTFNCTINQGGAGALTMLEGSTFDNITNTVQPASILFTAGTTTTFNNFNLNGTAGNLITIGSVTAASHTLSKASGTVSGNYLSISRSSATGGASWYAGANSTDGGNNTGWIFTAPPVFAPGVFLGNGLTIGAGITYSV